MGMGRLLKFGFCSKKHDTIGILKPKPSKGLYFLPTIAWTRTLNGKDIKVMQKSRMLKHILEKMSNNQLILKNIIIF